MDLLTQGLLGGVLAQSIAKKEDTKLAAVVGFIAGLLADADILIYSSTDPLLNIEFHRHFTHSLFFIPFGAAIASALLWPFLKNKLPPARLYIYSLLGYSMSGLLDACTSYGTHLFWPLADERIAFNIISIIDPVFTLILLVSLVYSLRMQSQKIAKIGLVLSASYMMLGLVQNNRAMAIAKTLVEERGHQAQQHIIKPTIANVLLWRSVYIYDGKIYVDAVRAGMFSESKVYPGDSVEQLSLTKHFSQLDSNSTLYKDIQRFTTLSEGYSGFSRDRSDVIGDIRYSMLPISIAPLWGIVIDENNPERHADYQFFRDTNSQLRKQFLNMILGKDENKVN